MSRKYIFEMIYGSFDLAHELQRLKRLFEIEHPVFVFQDGKNYSVRGYVAKYGFYQWKNRGRCIDADDFLSIFEYDKLWISALLDTQYLFTLIEIIYNFCWIVKRASNNVSVSVDGDNEKHFLILEKSLTECLAHYNYKGEYFPQLEQLIVIEDKPEVTAVVEIVDSEIGNKVLRYNHYMLKGDLQTKKDILLAIGADLEPKRKQIQEIDKNLEDGIFYLLNNLNLRHNNKSKGDKNYRQAVAEMDNASLESWYDELYQMMLLAYLHLDQIERTTKIKSLKQHITPR